MENKCFETEKINRKITEKHEKFSKLFCDKWGVFGFFLFCSKQITKWLKIHQSEENKNEKCQKNIFVKNSNS
jgi:hypothetical protein